MTSDNGGVAPPRGAVQVHRWEGPAGRRFRFFKGTGRGQRVSVETVGFQFSDGRIDKPLVHVHADHVDLDLTDIENVIADLIAARDEIRRLNS